MYDKAVSEIKEIIKNKMYPNNFEASEMGEGHKIIALEDLEQLDKDLSDFLIKFEEGLIQEGVENAEFSTSEEKAMFDKNDLD